MPFKDVYTTDNRTNMVDCSVFTLSSAGAVYVWCVSVFAGVCVCAGIDTALRHSEPCVCAGISCALSHNEACGDSQVEPEH